MSYGGKHRQHGMKFRIDGFQEIDKALGDLSLTHAKQATRRAMKKSLQPVADRAKQLAPEDDGQLKEAIAVSTRLTARQRRHNRKNAGQVNMFVGPGEGAPHGTLQEHGTEHHAPQPFLTPAWEQLKMSVLETLKIEMWEAIKRRQRLNAAKAARDAARAVKK